MGMSAAHCQGNVREFQCLESGHPEIKNKILDDRRGMWENKLGVCSNREFTGIAEA